MTDIEERDAKECAENEKKFGVSVTDVEMATGVACDLTRSLAAEDRDITGVTLAWMKDHMQQFHGANEFLGHATDDKRTLH